MVRTDGFVGKRKVKGRWEDGGFIAESQLETGCLQGSVSIC